MGSSVYQSDMKSHISKESLDGRGGTLGNYENPGKTPPKPGEDARDWTTWQARV
jgi:hypothetical protein